MKIETTFKLGGDKEDKLGNALACARELSAVECSWHKRHARVQVALDEDGELKWAINDACCLDLKRELAKAIEQVSPKL